MNTKRRTLVQCVRLAARRRNQVYTVLPGSRGCHRNSQRVSVGWRMWGGTSRRGVLEGVRTENEDWGRETAAY